MYMSLETLSFYLSIFEVQTVLRAPIITCVLILLKYGFALAYYLRQNPYIFPVQTDWLSFTVLGHCWTPFESTQNMNFSSIGHFID